MAKKNLPLPCCTPEEYAAASAARWAEAERLEAAAEAANAASAADPSNYDLYKAAVEADDAAFNFKHGEV